MCLWAIWIQLRNWGLRRCQQTGKSGKKRLKWSLRISFLEYFKFFDERRTVIKSHRIGVTYVSFLKSFSQHFLSCGWNEPLQPLFFSGLGIIWDLFYSFRLPWKPILNRSLNNHCGTVVPLRAGTRADRLCSVNIGSESNAHWGGGGEVTQLTGREWLIHRFSEASFVRSISIFQLIKQKNWRLLLWDASKSLYSSSFSCWCIVMMRKLTVQLLTGTAKEHVVQVGYLFWNITNSIFMPHFHWGVQYSEVW